MSDDKERELERQVAAGDLSGLGRLKAAWARSLVWRDCPDCDAHVPELAWSRHRYIHEHEALVKRWSKRQFEREQAERAERWEAERTAREAEDEAARGRGGQPRQGSTRSMPVVQIPAVGTVGARPRWEPIWHRIEIQPGETRVRFFNSAAGTSNMANRQRGYLQAASQFWLYGVSLIPDMGAPASEVQRIYNEGECRILLGGAVANRQANYILGNYASRTLMPPSREFLADEVMADPSDDLAERIPIRSLVISKRPIEIVALEAFSFDMDVQGIQNPVGVMAVFHGLWLKGLARHGVRAETE